MPNWLLPENIADVLPSEARKIEELRRLMLDNFRLYGYELVMPPLLEYLESLLTGAGKDTDLRTFKLVDQMSGRMLGLRAPGVVDGCAMHAIGGGLVVIPQVGQPLSEYETLDFEHYFVQAMDGPLQQDNLKLAIDYCKAHPQWKLSVQTHKLLQIP